MGVSYLKYMLYNIKSLWQYLGFTTSNFDFVALFFQSINEAWKLYYTMFYISTIIPILPAAQQLLAGGKLSLIIGGHNLARTWHEDCLDNVCHIMLGCKLMI